MAFPVGYKPKGLLRFVFALERDLSISCLRGFRLQASDGNNEIEDDGQTNSISKDLNINITYNSQNITSPSGDVRNRAKKTVKKSSSVYQLDPFLCKGCILRVGGRIRRAGIPETIKHPCIRPKKSHVTELVICHHHQKIAHQGRGSGRSICRSQSHFKVCQMQKTLVHCTNRKWQICQKIVWTQSRPSRTARSISLDRG